MSDPDLVSLNSSIKQLTAAILSEIRAGVSASKITAMTRGFGALNLGNSGNSSMASSLATDGAVASALASANRADRNSSILTGLGQVTTGLFTGIGRALPDTANVLSYAGGFYSAATMGGGNYNALGKRTLGLMGNGVTSAQAPAEVAAVLTGMGIDPNSAQYNNLVRSTANASKYLNIPNAVAAQAFGGLTSGGTSQAMMRNFGMYTTNPLTGERYTPTQIFEQLNQRFTLGQNLNRSDILTSLQGGALSVNLQNSGLDQTQQALLAQYMLDRASGKSVSEVDYGNSAAMSNLSKDNPYASAMAINASDASVNQAAMQTYIDGMKEMVPWVQNLNKVGKDLVEQFGKLKVALDVLGGNATAQGGMNALLALGAGGYVAGRAVSKYRANNAAAKNAGLGTTGKTAGARVKAGAKTGLVSLAAGLLSEPAGNMVAQSTGSSKLGNAASTAMNWGAWGATIGSFIEPGLGTAIGAGIGTIAGGIYGYATGGDSSSIGLGASSGNGKPDFALPVRGAITLKFNVVDSNHPNGHRGVDFGVSEGTVVQSVGAGTVANVYYSNAIGNVIVINHANNYTSLYANLQSTNVRIGDNVIKGQEIAKSGNTGSKTTGAHLHLEMTQNGSLIDPMGVLGGAVSVVGGTGPSGQGSSGVSGMSGSSDALLGFSSKYTDPNSAAVPSSYSGASMVSGAVSVSKGGSGASNGRGHVSQSGTSAASGPSNTNSGGGDAPTGTTNNVTINVSVANASEDEARKFAQMVKTYLEKDTLAANMRSL